VSRTIHLLLAAFLGIFLYSPLAESAGYALFVQVVLFPAFALTGLVMWKGRVVKGLLGERRSTRGG